MSASTNLGGKNFTYTSKAINFFGYEASRSGRGSWVINWALGGSINAEVRPENKLPDDIQLCINQDIAAGKGDKIAMLLVNPINGAILFLMDIITPEHLGHAQEHNDYIEIPDVEICDRILTVRVYEEPEYSFATADANGDII